MLWTAGDWSARALSAFWQRRETQMHRRTSFPFSVRLECFNRFRLRVLRDRTSRGRSEAIVVAEKFFLDPAAERFFTAF
jgi:hypothetical protein